METQPPEVEISIKGSKRQEPCRSSPRLILPIVLSVWDHNQTGPYLIATYPCRTPFPSPRTPAFLDSGVTFQLSLVMLMNRRFVSCFQSVSSRVSSPAFANDRRLGIRHTNTISSRTGHNSITATDCPTLQRGLSEKALVAWNGITQSPKAREPATVRPAKPPSLWLTLGTASSPSNFLECA